jgi:hypothetical protein
MIQTKNHCSRARGEAMADKTVDILGALLKQAPGVEPTCIRSTDWFDDEQRGTPETDTLWKDFLRQYRSLVREVTATWGPAEFEGNWEAERFPAWHHWVARLAYWQRGNAIAYIECDHPDPETPMLLSLGAKAGAELEDRNAEAGDSYD